MTSPEPMPSGMIFSEEQQQALLIARYLADAGVPIFIAHPALCASGEWDPSGGTGNTGYFLPRSWQSTVADPSTVDSWRPGDALCLVTGHGLDALDVDPRHGGDKHAEDLRQAGLWPRIYAQAATPSGGTHDLVGSLGVSSRNGFRPGLDIKAGTADGQDHGFVFIAPTIRKSKTTGELVPYRWLSPPDMDAVRDGDATGEELAQLIRSGRADGKKSRTVAQIADPVAYLAKVKRGVATAEPGTRNDTLNVAAFTLGGLVGSGQLSRDVAEELLVAPALEVGLTPRRITATIHSGLTAGIAQFRTSALNAHSAWDAGDAGDENPQSAVDLHTSDGKTSVATRLVQLFKELYDVSLADDGTVFAVPKSGPRLVHPLRGGRLSLRSALARLFFSRTGRAASQQALADALMILEGQGQQTEPQTVHLRVADAEGAWWIDLGDQTGCAVKVTELGWELAPAAPVLFRRSVLTSPLPHPTRGAELNELWKLLNVQAEDRPLLLAWLVAVLIPDIAHPILGLFGEQGTGKTTAGKILSALFDPSPVPVRKAPHDANAWVTAASGSWVVALDNISAVPDWLSDTLCRAVTGDGDVRRQLYTDGDLVVFAFRRAVIVTSIDIGSANGDFVDRLLAINLDPISDTQRVTDSSLWPVWNRVHPRVLGALLDLASKVKALLPSIKLDSRPRMADFMEVLATVDQITKSAGSARYRTKMNFLATDSLTGDPFVAEITNALDPGEEWEGTSAELLEKATPTSERWRPPKSWPASARVVTTQLRRQAPVMRKAGWTADDLGSDNHDKVIRWRLRAPEKEGQTRPPSPRPPHTAGDAGVAGDEYLLPTDPAEF